MLLNCLAAAVVLSQIPQVQTGIEFPDRYRGIGEFQGWGHPKQWIERYVKGNFYEKRWIAGMPQEPFYTLITWNDGLINCFWATANEKCGYSTDEVTLREAEFDMLRWQAKTRLTFNLMQFVPYPSTYFNARYRKYGGGDFDGHHDMTATDCEIALNLYLTSPILLLQLLSECRQLAPQFEASRIIGRTRVSVGMPTFKGELPRPRVSFYTESSSLAAVSLIWPNGNITQTYHEAYVRITRTTDTTVTRPTKKELSAMETSLRLPL